MKTKLLFLFFILLYAAIIGKLFYIQLVSKKFQGSNLYLKTSKITPDRGNIYDVNGNPLVLNQNSYLLYLEPKKITDKFDLINKLSQNLNIPEASLAAEINDNLVYQAIKGGIDEGTKNTIANLNLPGVGFTYETKRFYPEASLSAHLLGFVGKDSQGADVGYFGIEGYYDKDLAGLPGFLETERDLLGRPIFIGTQNLVSAENGSDLYLTIDKSVQEIAKSNLETGMEKYQASSGCVIVADPNTMAIKALSCLPDFDPDKYYMFTEKYFENQAVSEVFEPGSIFKPLIMAAAINEKRISPTDTMDESGPVKIGQYTIQTWDNTYEGVISMTRILEKSSNVGMVWVGDKLGPDLMYKYLKKYGFGQTTGIDLQGEVPSYLKPQSDLYPIDYATMTFGQGIAVTPIQIIRAFASVINGGRLMRPYVVEKIKYGQEIKTIKPEVQGYTVSPLTSEIMRKMLIDTVDHGEVKWSRPAGYKIGGKTGTAQVPIKGVYDPSKTIASFIGFAPADNPKFIVMVMYRDPKASIWGSETAAPVFFDIARQLFIYYNIPPQ